MSLIPATKQKLSGISDEAVGNQFDDVILSGCLNWRVSNVPRLLSLRVCMRNERSSVVVSTEEPSGDHLADLQKLFSSGEERDAASMEA